MSHVKFEKCYCPLTLFFAISMSIIKIVQYQYEGPMSCHLYCHQCRKAPYCMSILKETRKEKNENSKYSKSLLNEVYLKQNWKTI